MAVSYDDYKKKYQQSFKIARQYNQINKINNQTAEEAKAEHKKKSNIRQTQINDLIKKYNNQGIVIQKSGILPTAGSVVLNRVNNKDYNIQNQLDRISGGKSLVVESAKEEQENVDKFNAANQQKEIAKQTKKLDQLTKEKSQLEGRLKNEKFVSNAPAELVEQTKQRISEIDVQLKAIEELVSSLK